MMEILDEMHVLDAWFVTRIRLDEWIVTHLRGKAPFERGASVELAPPMREALLRGRLPKTRAEIELDALAARTPTRTYVEHAFVGAPLVVQDELYGVLCGLDISSEVHAGKDSPSVMLAARFLSTILRHELDAEELVRRAERAEAEALVDELTGLFNRRGWERLTDGEETRSARYGHGATVFVMDVDGLKRKNDEEGHAAGDELLRKVATAIRGVTREHDIAARMGGDEFAILAVESDDEVAAALHARLTAAFADAGVKLSIGAAHREYAGGIAAALERADAQMYRRKAERAKAG